jgi:hypothetical protein
VRIFLNRFHDQRINARHASEQFPARFLGAYTWDVDEPFEEANGIPEQAALFNCVSTCADHHD